MILKINIILRSPFNNVLHSVLVGILEKWFHYMASEVIPCIFGVFTNKIEKGGGGGRNRKQQTYQFSQG